MSDIISLLGAIDRTCGQFATALHNSELQIYTTMALLVILSALLLPPRDGSDQI